MGFDFRSGVAWFLFVLEKPCLSSLVRTPENLPEDRKERV